LTESIDEVSDSGWHTKSDLCLIQQSHRQETAERERERERTTKKRRRYEC
jgi:hypothetical protein